ncbi:MAG TPA: tetratricopeptide repeat protein, partial [Pseudobdellovibrionaceae bacterium]|nr:tetratricopeptide repeat protein [Pseudobdellovibrionaceae bacterium]
MRSRTAFSLFLIILPSLGHSGTKDATKEFNKEAAAEVMITHSEEKAIASLQEIIRAQKTQSDKSQYLHRLAELYLRRSKTSRFFENMDSQSPLTASFPEVQGKSRKWLEEAIQIYNQIIQKDPKYASIDEVFFSTGFLHAQLSQAAQARSNLKQALVANPNKYEAMLSLAELEYDQKNFRQAEGYYRQLVDLKVDMAKHFVKYKMSWAMYNQKNTQQALDNHLEVVMQIPESPYRKEALKDLALFIAETSKGENVSQTIPNEINKEDRKTLIDRIVGLLVTWSRAGEIKPLLEREILSFPEYRHEYQARLLTISFERKDLLTASQILNEFQTSCRFEDCTNVRPVVKTQLKNMWELEAKEKSPQRKTLMLSAFAVLLIDEKDLVTLQSYAEFLTEYKDNTPAAEAWMNLFDRSSDSAQKEDALYKSIHLTADGFDKEGKIDQFVKLYKKSPRAVEFLYVKALELAKSQDYAESLKILNDIKGRASAKDLNEKIASLITQVEYDQLVNSADP